MLKAAQAYLQTQVTTTSQGDLLVLLYDGAIKFLKQAKEKIAARDFAGKGVLISKAIDVVSELDASLNIEKGGEIAENLHKLYFYCNTRLLKANLYMNTEFIDEVVKILDGLRAAYAQIGNMDPAQVQQAAAQQPQPAHSGPKPKTLLFPNQAAQEAPPAPAAQAEQPIQAVTRGKPLNPYQQMAQQAAAMVEETARPKANAKPAPKAAKEPAQEADQAEAKPQTPIHHRKGGGAAMYQRIFDQT